jgi:hypothetical protein
MFRALREVRLPQASNVLLFGFLRRQDDFTLTMRHESDSPIANGATD